MLKILVVDDEPLICELIAEALADIATVQCAETGDAGAALIAAHTFDLALIDVILPGQSGIALAELAASKDTPCLLMTGGTFDKFALVRFPCISKPFPLQKLTEEVKRTIVEGHRNVLLVKEALARMKAENLQADSKFSVSI